MIGVIALLSACRLPDLNSDPIGDCYARGEGGIEITYIGGYPYAKRKRIPVKEADPASFRLLADSQNGNCGHDPLYGIDHQNVFFRQHTLPAANPAAFQAFGGGYGGDDKRLYYREKLVEGISPQGFRIEPIPYVNGVFGVSPSGILHRDILITARPDPASFTALGGSWLRDANAIYLKNQPDPIQGADPTTFRVLPLPKRKRMHQPFAKDANRVYLLAESGLSILDGADPASFKLLNQHYAKDRNRVYYHGDIIEGADADSFQVKSRAFAHSAHDSHRRYHMGKAVEP